MKRPYSLGVKIVLSCWLLSAISCRHEPLVEENPDTGICVLDISAVPDCADWANVDTNEWDYITEYIYPLYDAPCFNPLNGNEFLFKRVSPVTHDEILVADLDALIPTEIFDNQDAIDGLPVGEEPQWGLNRIFFHRFDGVNNAIYRMMNDGSELTQITIDETNVAPSPSDTEEKFICGTTNSIGSVIRDYSGQVLSEVTNPFEGPNGLVHATWKDKRIAYYSSGSGEEDICIYFTDTGEFEKVFALEEEELYDMEWMPNCNALVLCLWSGIYILDLDTLELVKIKDQCQTVRYRYISVSPDGQKILARRADRTLVVVPVTADTIQYKYSIALMNIDGTDEVILDLE